MTEPKPYMPSNGTEGECFESAWCAKCQHDDYENDVYCALLAKSHCGEQPEEWIYKCGAPTCTAFRDVNGAPAEKRCEETMEMF